MVGFLGLLGRGAGIIKRNPIKTFAIVLLIGSSIGVYFLGRSLVDEYNDTMRKIEAVQEENSDLRGRLENAEEIQDQILNRVRDVEESRARIQEELEESQIRIDRFTEELRNIDFENSPISVASDDVNVVWSLVIECAEQASRDEERSEVCENISLPQPD